ncbi:hypothetical protein ACS0TY_013677 [Phlomoides rotata]
MIDVLGFFLIFFPFYPQLIPQISPILFINIIKYSHFSFFSITYKIREDHDFIRN